MGAKAISSWRFFDFKGGGCDMRINARRLSSSTRTRIDHQFSARLADFNLREDIPSWDCERMY